MLKIGVAKTEPFWIDLGDGARVQFKPITPVMIVMARQASADAMKALTPAPAEGAEAAPQAAPTDAVFVGTVAFTRQLAISGAIAWEGIGNADGTPIDLTRENMDALLELWPAFDKIDRLYVNPALITVSEKNV